MARTIRVLQHDYSLSSLPEARRGLHIQTCINQPEDDSRDSMHRYTRRFLDGIKNHVKCLRPSLTISG
jgi:hypothetical protein